MFPHVGSDPLISVAAAPIDKTSFILPSARTIHAVRPSRRGARASDLAQIEKAPQLRGRPCKCYDTVMTRAGEKLYGEWEKRVRRDPPPPFPWLRLVVLVVVLAGVWQIVRSLPGF